MSSSNNNQLLFNSLENESQTPSGDFGLNSNRILLYSHQKMIQESESKGSASTTDHSDQETSLEEAPVSQENHISLEVPIQNNFGENNQNDEVSHRELPIMQDFQEDINETETLFGAEQALIDNEYMKDFYGNSYLRKVCAILITCIISTPICLEILDKKDCSLELLIVMFFCVLYLGLEDVIEYYGPEQASWKKKECLYTAIDKGAAVFFLIFMNFKFCQVITGKFLLLAPLPFVVSTVFYAVRSNAPKCLKEFNIVMKLIYSSQTCLIVLKLSKCIDYDWVETFFPLLLYAGSWACYAILISILLVSVTASSMFERGSSGSSRCMVFLKRVINYTWYILYSGLSALFLGIIVLSLRDLNTSDNENDLLRRFIQFGGYYCSFLLGYTVIFYNFIKSFVMDFKDTVEFYSGNTVKMTDIPSGYAFESQTEMKTMNLLKVSSTYFSEVPKGYKEGEDLEAQQKTQEQEEVLCYICEKNLPDAVLMSCRHGGVCCECAVESLRSKNQCMQCRSPVESLYKINEKGSGKTVVEAQEYIRIIPVNLDF